MSITREDVEDLREGDVVELRWLDGTRLVGTTRERRDWEPGGLMLGPITIRHPDGAARVCNVENATLTVVSRAPRPLYVNHPRTEPVSGDVAQGGGDGNVFLYRPARGFDEPQWWFWDGQILSWTHGDAPASLRLLVDGETGQVVP